MEEIVRIGTVTAVNSSEKTVRVLFPEEEIVSDWLTVVQRGEKWLPSVNDPVLCLYNDGTDGDGYVLGVTK